MWEKIVESVNRIAAAVFGILTVIMLVLFWWVHIELMLTW